MPAVYYRGGGGESAGNQERADQEESDSEEGLQRQHLSPVGASRAQIRGKPGPPRGWAGETGGQERASSLSRK